MPSTLQNVMIGEELLVAIRLLKTGLRELNRMDQQTSSTSPFCCLHLDLSE